MNKSQLFLEEPEGLRVGRWNERLTGLNERRPNLIQSLSKGHTEPRGDFPVRFLSVTSPKMTLKEC
jgi:hypothetical protein